MKHVNTEDSLRCITPVRRNAVRKAVLMTNASIHALNSENPKMRKYLKADPRRRADLRRIHLYFNISAEFHEDETVFVRNDYGGLVLEIDETHALHFKQRSAYQSPYMPTWVNYGIVDALDDQHGWALEWAEYIEQHALFPDLVDSKVSRINVPPLEKLYPLIAVFEVDEIDGSIVQLHIRDCITDYSEEIELSQAPIKVETVAEAKKGKIRISKKA